MSLSGNIIYCIFIVLCHKIREEMLSLERTVMVKRVNFVVRECFLGPHTEKEEDPEGSYVDYDDYKILEDKLEAAEKRIGVAISDKIITEIILEERTEERDSLKDRVRELTAQLALLQEKLNNAIP